MALFGNVTGFLKQNVFGYALGTAAGPALRPFIQELANEAWTIHPARPLGAEVLAQGVAQGQVDEGWAREWAAKGGISGDAFGRLVEILNVGPGVGPAFDLWRRGLIGDAGFARALKRQGIEAEWFGPLQGLKQHLLSPAELANARQQGFVTEAEQLAEAALQGINADRADIQFKLAGLPPAVETGLSMLRRGIIDETMFGQIVREGHTKSKYIPQFLQMRRAVLSATEYASARLRNWISEDEAASGGAKTGYSREDMELLFLNRGRPASPTQMWTAYFRKAKGPRGVATSYEDHAKAIAISDIRPEYAELLWEIRFAYPSLFQLGRLVQTGAINPQTAALWASYNRYGPDVLEPLTTYWESVYTPGGATGAKLKALTEAELRAEYEGGFLTADALQTALGKLGYTPEQAAMLQDLGDAARVKTYRDKVLAAVHKAFVEHTIEEATATATMTAEHIGEEAQAQLLGLWRLERDFARHSLTGPQIKRAYKKTLIDRATALAELVERGYTASDAATLLDE